ncbi:MAG: GAF domain-containing protein [Pseudanabaena sp.]|jgi:GAF domain-containing protein|nr:GAF domain-containing protein [Pseudanabaena sp. M53BS1SP1A06MG]MCA6584174.1 GAF domain-containing protein [Pseudanabaena sp. M34BS1SP1A06MG]MCA6587451.1 GAF domain-containing protein [Pseudanabaena sp. M051S1SP1A06QC]MCA6590897.1 GAF domain-containing protein [Pseudanabaena sp. M38BS1SP1A06MG]MCA6598940.1 GAF domain-containing protein [Pseudanabaena sp. M57BS1SP1A06MG]
MDSPLFDQIRHLCRDRGSYERLKAILVQQERIHQINWQERYENLMSAQVDEMQASKTFSNIIAREKALAQLADAIQRSPSLDLVLQVAVQVTLQLLQVDRVAIFRRYGDGRGELTTDAIAAGLVSISDMPERQLLLAKHMVDLMQSEQSAQIVDSICNSSIPSHIVSLLEQIGISSYAANKIYAEQEEWGTIFAFHSSVYHAWSESDRTSLALVAAQIGIAISLANMRQQSQILADDLQVLQAELNSLQETVNEIIESQSKSIETSDNELDNTSVKFFLDDNDPIISKFAQNVTEEKIAKGITVSDLAKSSEQISNLDTDIPAENLTSVMGGESVKEEEIVSPESVEAINTVSEHLEHLADSQDVDTNKANSEISTDELISESISEADSQVEAQVTLQISEQEKPNLDNSPQEAIASSSELETVTTKSPFLEVPKTLFELQLETHSSEAENHDLENPVLEESKSAGSEASVDHGLKLTVIESQVMTEIENSEQEMKAIRVVSPFSDDDDTQQDNTLQTHKEKINNHIYDEDRDPPIELQFIETILSVAGNDDKGIKFLLEVIDSYLEETYILVQAIDKSLSSGDHLRLLQTLNTLRSSSEYVGALSLAYQCRQLESAVRANYVVLIYACLSQVAIEAQRATEALRIERSRYVEKLS